MSDTFSETDDEMLYIPQYRGRVQLNGNRLLCKMTDSQVSRLSYNIIHRRVVYISRSEWGLISLIVSERLLNLLEPGRSFRKVAVKLTGIPVTYLTPSHQQTFHMLWTAINK